MSQTIPTVQKTSQTRLKFTRTKASAIFTAEMRLVCFAVFKIL